MSEIRQIQVRHDTSSNWTTSNPILALGEIGFESNTKRFKIGDGATAWTSLGYKDLSVIMLDVGDETTNLTTGTAKKTFRMPFAMTLLPAGAGVRASVNTAPTGSTIIVDINEGGSTILSTKLSIDASEKTSVTAASAAVISDTVLAEDAEITIDLDQVGSSTPGKGLKVVLIGYRT